MINIWISSLKLMAVNQDRLSPGLDSRTGPPWARGPSSGIAVVAIEDIVDKASCRINQDADCNLGPREAVQPSLYLPAAPTMDPCRLSPQAQFQSPVALYSATAIGPQVGGLEVSCRIAKLHPNFSHFLPPSNPGLRHEKNVVPSATDRSFDNSSQAAAS